MKTNGKPYVVPIETLSEALGLSRARTYDLVQRAILPRASRGRYDLVGCFRAYLAHVTAGRGDPDLLALRRAKAERAQLELDVRKREVERAEGGPLVSVAAANEFLARAFDAYRESLAAFPSRIAGRLVNLRRYGQALKVLEPAHDAAMNAAVDLAYDRAVGREPHTNGDGRAT